MRVLRYMVLAILFLLVITVIIGFLLPSKVHLERSTFIDREPSQVFSVINSLKNFNHWSPWYALDKNATYTYSGSESGVGSKIDWNGNQNVGKGSNEIIKSVKNSYISTKFYFGMSDQPAFSKISLEKIDQKTKVTWAFNNDFGYNVFYRYFGLVLEDMIAPDYEKGLSNLKIHVESLPIYDYSDITMVTTVSEALYTIEVKTNPNDDNIADAIGASFANILAFTGANQIEMSGAPKVITHKTDKSNFILLAAIPVSHNNAIDETGNIKAQNSYQGRAVKLIHRGSYSNFKKSYDVMDAYMKQNNLQTNGNSWEDFVTDPGLVTENNLITHIYQPIKN